MQIARWLDTQRLEARERFQRRLARQGGQGMVEYALILVLIAVVVIVILTQVGQQVNNVFSNISNGISGGG
jgi:pilus assembly protein Flp/PilA